jgi:hypothetical protein
MICRGIADVFDGLAALKSIHKWLEFCHRKGHNASNKTRQGYARKRILKPAGSSFLGCVL